MDPETRRKINRDYTKTGRRINRIIRGHRLNVKVTKQNYINPELEPWKPIPKDDFGGELRYLIPIRNCLEEVLLDEHCSHSIPNAPDYVKQFYLNKP